MDIYRELATALWNRDMLDYNVHDILYTAIVSESDNDAQWPGLLAEVCAGIDGETSALQGVVDEALYWLPYDEYDYLED